MKLREVIDSYTTLKRALGASFKDAGGLLTAFSRVGFANQVPGHWFAALLRQLLVCFAHFDSGDLIRLREH